MCAGFSLLQLIQHLNTPAKHSPRALALDVLTTVLLAEWRDQSKVSGLGTGGVKGKWKHMQRLFTWLKCTWKFPMTCMLAFLYIYIFLNKAWQQFRPRIKITALCHPKARAEGTSMLCQLLCPCCWQTVPGLAPPEQAGGKKHPFSQPLFGDVHAALPSDVLCSVWKAQFGRFLKPATSS